MAKGKEKKEKAPMAACFIGLDGAIDLGRHVCGFSHGTLHINAIKMGGKFRLFAQGEKVDGRRMLYCVDTDRIGGFGIYNSGTDSPEQFEIRESINAEDYRLYKSPIIELDGNPFTIEDGKKIDIVQLRVSDYRGLIKALLNDSGGDEAVTKVYAFPSGKDHYIGSFDVIRDGGGVKVFAYAKVDAKGPFSAFSYNYGDGSVEAAESLIGKSNIYVRVINLAQPFPFFKPK